MTQQEGQIKRIHSSMLYVKNPNFDFAKYQYSHNAWNTGQNISPISAVIFQACVVTMLYGRGENIYEIQI